MHFIEVILIFLVGVIIIVTSSAIYYNQERQIELQEQANKLLERNSELLCNLIDSQFEEDNLEEDETDESSPFYQVDRDEHGRADPADWWKTEKNI